MARILIAAVVAVLLLGAPLAADQMLQNPDLEPASASADTQQQDFAEATAPFIDVGVPVSLFALTVGAILVAVRRVGG